MLEVLSGPGPIIAVQEFFGPGWLWFFHAVTLLGTSVAILPLAGLVFWFHGRRPAYRLIALIIVGNVVSGLLWVVFDLPRPDDPQIVVRSQVPMPSFPSVHVATATILWVWLASRGFVPTFLPAVAVPAVMLSRLYLGVHFFRDVLAGALIGLGLVLVWTWVLSLAERRLSRLPFELCLLLVMAALGALLVQIPFVPAGASTEVWRSLGAAIGGLIGGLIEYYLVRYDPASLSQRMRVLVTLFGLGGLALLISPTVGIFGQQPEGIVAITLVGLGALWAILVVPATVKALGRARNIGARP